jgi:hypoxanthine-guanine phosphoribosyltransferase
MPESSTKIVFTAEQIAMRVRELADRMKGERPIALVPILTGAITFTADLLRHLPASTVVSPMLMDPYHRGMVLAEPDLLLLLNRDVWVVDNSMASGVTLYGAVKAIRRHRTIVDLKTVVLYRLLEGHPMPIEPTLCGFFHRPTGRLIGYGQDQQGTGRGLRDIVGYN